MGRLTDFSSDAITEFLPIPDYDVMIEEIEREIEETDAPWREQQEIWANDAYEICTQTMDGIPADREALKNWIYDAWMIDADNAEGFSFAPSDLHDYLAGADVDPDAVADGILEMVGYALRKRMQL